MRRPNLFIVGEPKTGTSALHEFLGQHPAVFMSRYKEPRYFCTDLHRASDAFHGARRFFPLRDEHDYLQLFASARDEAYVGESSPEYLLSTDAAAGIRAMSPEARIIALFRDPIDLLYSLYFQLKTNSDEGAASFEEALALEPARRRGERLSRRVGCPTYLYYEEWARFGDHLERFLSEFPREQILIASLDDLRADPAGTYRRVLEFLGVDPTFEPRFAEVNATTTVRFRRLRQLIRSKPVWALKPYLPVSVYHWGNRVMDAVFSRPVDKPALPAELAARLRPRLAPQVRKLSELAGRDFAAEWGYG